jgi:hypothetical protein
VNLLLSQFLSFLHHNILEVSDRISLNLRANKPQIHNLGEAQASLNLYIPPPMLVLKNKSFKYSNLISS